MPDKNELINTDSTVDTMNESIENGLSDTVHSMSANASENIVFEEDSVQDVDMSMEELNLMLQNLGVEPLTVIDQKTKSILEGEQENVSMKNIAMDKDHSEKIMKKNETILHETNEPTISEDKDQIQESEYRDENDLPILVEDDHTTEENLILTNSNNNNSNNKGKNVLRKISKQNLRDKKVSFRRFNIKDIVAGVSSLRTKRVWNHLQVPFLAKLANRLKRPGSKTKSNVMADVSQNLDEARVNKDSVVEENSETLKTYETEDNKNPLKGYATEDYNESLEQDKEKQNDSIEQDKKDSQILHQTPAAKDSGKSGERRKKEKPRRLMTKRKPLFFWITATLATFMISFVLLLLVLYLRQEALDKMNMNGLSEIEQVRFSQGTVDQNTFLPWSPDPEPVLESLKIIDESANGRNPAKE